MFPFVYGFTYDAGNLIFLGVFFSVVILIGTTFALAGMRAYRGLRERKVDTIRWHEDFHDLPIPARACRHELCGEVKKRTCPNGFDCRVCDVHSGFTAGGEQYMKDTLGSVSEESAGGLTIAHDRFYHRGHTWVRAEDDGTLLVGLDDLARRLVGNADAIRLPAPGTPLSVNGTGWHMQRGKQTIRILSPVEGTVVETGGSDGEWYLRVRPAGSKADVRHLLRGWEAKAWMTKELERLQVALGVPDIGPALADGGEPVLDMPATSPEADWDKVWGEMLLEP